MSKKTIRGQVVEIRGRVVRFMETSEVAPWVVIVINENWKREGIRLFECEFQELNPADALLQTGLGINLENLEGHLEQIEKKIMDIGDEKFYAERNKGNIQELSRREEGFKKDLARLKEFQGFCMSVYSEGRR